MPFKKGQSGNPRGRKPGTRTKAKQEIEDASRALIEDKDYLISLKDRLKGGRAPHMETLLFQYAYGKPADVTKHEGGVRLIVSWQQ